MADHGADLAELLPIHMAVGAVTVLYLSWLWGLWG